ncbi:restriction endonuclease subunit S [Shewanella sp. Isolate7]|uniref:restriction endonuclease subunit S n=1 Tax=Shewanella sp. Isolate7 TaxID=2908528 RepID=UPI001EFEE923|nr:restriction endonuclease subunit S [Shewanella sp. Isolate7]MCG9723390.1 restriction endonuclease subunit S [Shewanella sp. Isolate7]
MSQSEDIGLNTKPWPILVDHYSKCAKASEDWIGSFGAFCSGIRPDNTKCVPSYLYYFLCSPTFRNWSGASDGANIKNIRASELAEFQIPLPPLETQKQIAAVLEKADQLRKDCKLLEQELNSLAQSVFIDMFGDPVTNPKGWDTASLDSLALVQIGPFGSQLHKEDYIADGIPLINPTHIVKGQIIPDMNLTLTPEKFETLPSYHLKAGDIVMGRRGEMGRTALIDERSQGWFCGTGSLYIRITSPLVQPVFLNSVMSCSSMKTWLEEQSLGATMPNLNKKILHSIQVPIPTEELQKNYLVALKGLRQQRTEQKEYINELDSLFNSLMQKAFIGEINL